MAIESKYKWFAGISLAVLTFGILYRRQVIRFGKDVINYAFTKEQEYYLANLHPKYINLFKNFIADVEKNLGYKVLITSGYRSFQEQKQLHSENSNNAQAGKSMHNYGAAIDINLISKKDGSQIKKADSTATWQKTGIVELANKYGLKWGGGGNFGSYNDTVHFEVPLGGDKMYAQAIKQYGTESKVIGNRVNIA